MGESIKGSSKAIMISKLAIVDETVIIQQNTQILDHASIGYKTKIGHNVFIGKGVKIGQYCNIQGNVFIPEGVEIGDGVFIGPSVTFCNVKHPEANKKGTFEKTVVENHVVIGANATILPGITIGERSIIGAGSVVTKDVQPECMVVGNPAKVVI